MNCSHVEKQRNCFPVATIARACLRFVCGLIVLQWRSKTQCSSTWRKSVGMRVQSTCRSSESRRSVPICVLGFFSLLSAFLILWSPRRSGLACIHNLMNKCSPLWFLQQLIHKFGPDAFRRNKSDVHVCRAVRACMQYLVLCIGQRCSLSDIINLGA